MSHKYIKVDVINYVWKDLGNVVSKHNKNVTCNMVQCFLTCRNKENNEIYFVTFKTYHKNKKILSFSSSIYLSKDVNYQIIRVYGHLSVGSFSTYYYLCNPQELVTNII